MSVPCLNLKSTEAELALQRVDMESKPRTVLSSSSIGIPIFSRDS